MFNTMSIRARLILAFSVLLALLLAVAAVSLQRLEGLTATTQDIVNYQARRVFLAQRINQHAQAAAISLLKLLQTPQRDERVPLYALMDEDIAASGAAVSDLAKTMLASDVQADIERVMDLRERYGVLLQETVELIEVESPAKARVHFEDRTQKVLNRFQSTHRSGAPAHRAPAGPQTETCELQTRTFPFKFKASVLAHQQRGKSGNFS